MGAAGYVAVYDEALVRAKYVELYPGRDIDKDWWYLKTITAELAGKKWIFDYGDDQGYHEGVSNHFWFESEEDQKRVLEVLGAVRAAASVEVWT